MHDVQYVCVINNKDLLIMFTFKLFISEADEIYLSDLDDALAPYASIENGWEIGDCVTVKSDVDAGRLIAHLSNVDIHACEAK
jgi:hypothetical protein